MSDFEDLSEEEYRDDDDDNDDDSSNENSEAEEEIFDEDNANDDNEEVLEDDEGLSAEEEEDDEEEGDNAMEINEEVAVNDNIIEENPAVMNIDYAQDERMQHMQDALFTGINTVGLRVPLGHNDNLRAIDHLLVALARAIRHNATYEHLIDNLKWIKNLLDLLMSEQQNEHYGEYLAEQENI